jgi:hypothetical protein
MITFANQQLHQGRSAPDAAIASSDAAWMTGETLGVAGGFR